MKSCRDCSKYQKCVALCEKAGRYISQDEVKQRELTIGIPLFAKNPFPSGSTPIKFSRAQKKILKLLHRGVPRHVIPALLEISRQTLSNQIWQMKGMVKRQEAAESSTGETPQEGQTAACKKQAD